MTLIDVAALRGLACCFVAAGPLLGCSSGTPGSAEQELTGSVSPILGGTLDHEHGAVVAVQHSLDSRGTRFALCSGSVFYVARDFALVLTAAHCVAEEDLQGEIKTPVVAASPQTVTVVSGVDPPSSVPESITFQTTEVRVDDRFNGYLGNPNDVAVLRITGAVATLPSLPISQVADGLRVGSRVTLVGFGDDEHAASGVRRATTQTVATLTDQFIGFDQRNGQGICSGDSGGPILVEEDGRQAIAGVNSLASGPLDHPCTTSGFGVRIARFESLLSDAIQGIPVDPSSVAGTAGLEPSPSSGHDADPGGACSFAPARPARTELLVVFALCGGLAFGWRRSNSRR